MKIAAYQSDLAIIGAGGAGLLAALHAWRAAPDLRITLLVKGLMGKCGCTRMVQGGYNVALSPNDSIERHFMDTIEGGAWLNDQELAWRLVNGAVERIKELENAYGCFFDRNADGTIHQKAFAGQTFDRTVHKGDLTGIEIVSRLAEQVRARAITVFEDHRAIGLIPAQDGARIAAVLLIDMRSGRFVLHHAKAVLLATGGGPTMYRYHTPSGDKSCDGLAMALDLGIALRDMEMVQFHPTGLLAGTDTRMTGTVLEEGLRGAGGHLLNAAGERFMVQADARAERATRDVVSRAIFDEMRAGRATRNGGVHLTMSHLGEFVVRRRFKGMVERCADCGFDLATGLVEVVPTAHYMMGGVIFNVDGSTSQPGLFAAGEDTGGVHGANRLGGNGVANSTVFGGIAGATMAAFASGEGRDDPVPDLDCAHAMMEAALSPFATQPGDLDKLRLRLQDVMWEHVGIRRNAAGLRQAQADLDNLEKELSMTGLNDRERAFNLTWHDWLNLRSLISVSRAITSAALARENSRGAHFRDDFPAASALASSTFTHVRQMDNKLLTVSSRPVAFTRVAPGEAR